MTVNHINRTWKDKHEALLRNRNIIIKIYNEDTRVEEIAKIYGLSGCCIYRNLKLWGVVRKGSIKYLLRKILLKDN